MPTAGRAPATLAAGAPNRGVIGWASEEDLIVVSAGRFGRWENFWVGRDVMSGAVQIKWVGWKPYGDDEMGWNREQIPLNLDDYSD